MGNSQTEIGTDLLTQASSEGDGPPDQIAARASADLDETRSHSADWDMTALEQEMIAGNGKSEESNDEDIKPLTISTKAKKLTKKTAANPMVSSPVEPYTSTKKSRNAMDRFNEVVIKEEETVQRALDLQKTHALARLRLREQHHKVKANLKMREMELRSQERLARIEMEHKLKMREMELRFGSGATGSKENNTPALGSSSFKGFAPAQWDSRPLSVSNWSPPSGPQVLLDDINEAAHNFGLPVGDLGDGREVMQ